MKRLYIVLLFMLTACSVHAMTAAEIITQVRGTMRDNPTDTTKRRWTDDQLLAKLNIVQNEICEATWCLMAKSTVTTTTGTFEYQYPSGLIKLLRAGYLITNSTGTYSKLTWTSIAGQDTNNKYWENKGTGLPLEYYERGNYIGIVPAPSSTYAGDKLQLTYITYATALTATTEIPLNSDTTLTAYHNIFTVGISALCFHEIGDDANANSYDQKYYALLEKMRTQLLNKPDKNPNFSK